MKSRLLSPLDPKNNTRWYMNMQWNINAVHPTWGEGSHCYNWEITKMNVDLWNPAGVESQVLVSYWDWVIEITTKGESGGVALWTEPAACWWENYASTPRQLLLWPPYYPHCYAQWLLKSYFGRSSWAPSNIYIFFYFSLLYCRLNGLRELCKTSQMAVAWGLRYLVLSGDVETKKQ